MGKVITDEDIKLNIFINGDSAQKELYNLEESTRDLNKQNVDLINKMKALEKQGKKTGDEYY